MGQYDPKTPKGLNSVSFGLLVVLLAAGYLGWFYVPHWWGVFRVAGVMKHAAYEAYRELDNNKLIDGMITRAGERGIRVTAENFTVERLPYTPEELVNMKGAANDLHRRRGKAVTIKFHYEVEAKWPLSSKKRTLVFDETRTQNIETITW